MFSGLFGSKKINPPPSAAGTNNKNAVIARLTAQLAQATAARSPGGGIDATSVVPGSAPVFMAPLRANNIRVGSAPVVAAEPRTPAEHLLYNIDIINKNKNIVPLNDDNAYYFFHLWVMYRNGKQLSSITSSMEIRQKLVTYLTINPGKITEFSDRVGREYSDGVIVPSTGNVGDYLGVLRKYLSENNNVRIAFDRLDRDRPIVYKGPGGGRKTRRSRKYRKKSRLRRR